MNTPLTKEKARETARSQSNPTGIPTQMKQEFEERSGLSFDDVRVHYGSDKPARLHALAYTQGSQIYVGPGQEGHLRHELGHVVQQKTGRVPATRSVNGVPVNDDPRLEAQADRFAVQRFRIPSQGAGAWYGAAQLCPCKEEGFSMDSFIGRHLEGLKRRLGERGWSLEDDECRALLEDVAYGGTPWIGNHNAVLTLRKNLGLYILRKVRSGTGSMGRLTDKGVCYEMKAQRIANGSTNPEEEREGAYTITRDKLRKKRRLPLQAVKGKSAADQTGTPGAEYLHIIAHRLGGEEADNNLVPGLHALNTAMIPLENLAYYLGQAGCEPEYRVTLNGGTEDPGPCVETAEIEIDVKTRSGDRIGYKFSLYPKAIPVNRQDYKLNEECFDAIDKLAGQCYGEILEAIRREVE